MIDEQFEDQPMPILYYQCTPGCLMPPVTSPQQPWLNQGSPARRTLHQTTTSLSSMLSPFIGLLAQWTTINFSKCEIRRWTEKEFSRLGSIGASSAAQITPTLLHLPDTIIYRLRSALILNSSRGACAPHDSSAAFLAASPGLEIVYGRRAGNGNYYKRQGRKTQLKN